MSSQMVPHYQREPTTSQMITPFIEPTQYLATIPPLHPTSSYPGTVSSPSHSSSDFLHSNVVLTPAQNQIQEQLQRKHEKLQKVIVQQQEELRRVSEQLYITTYGINSTIVNVPYSNTSDGRYHQPNYNQPQICPAPSSNMHQLQIPSQIHGQIEHLERKELSQDNCSEVSYLQLQPVSVSPSHLMPNTLSHHSMQSHHSSSSQHLQGQQHQQVNLMTQSEVESTPLQMGQEQAQLLFNSSGHSGRSPSTSRQNQ